MMNTVNHLQKMLKELEKLNKTQNLEADKQVQNIEDEEVRGKMKTLLQKARKGEVTAEQVMKEANGYINRD